MAILAPSLCRFRALSSREMRKTPGHSSFQKKLLGAFLGDIVEMIFCRLTMGVWMSRSSLVWGDFSLVWPSCRARARVLTPMLTTIKTSSTQVRGRPSFLGIFSMSPEIFG